MHKKINNKRTEINKIIQQALHDRMGKQNTNVDPNFQIFEELSETKNKNFKSNKIHQKNMSKVTNRRVNRDDLLRPDGKFLTRVGGKICKLKLPERGSFNGSIIEVGEKYLLIYRPHEFVFKGCFLTQDYQVINGKFFSFDLHTVADPRLIKTVDNRVLLSYASFENNHDYIAANYIMDLNISEEIILSETFRVSPEDLEARQKNWMPFVFEDKTYFISSVCPHEIYEFNADIGKSASKKYVTDWKHSWPIRKTLRGNTNAVCLPDGNFLTVFHTAMTKAGVVYYDNGAYIFEGKPPFKVLKCSKKTILPADFAGETHYRKAQEIICIFPMSLVLKQDRLIISYGDNDSAVKIIETTLSDVIDTMVDVI